MKRNLSVYWFMVLLTVGLMAGSAAVAATAKPRMGIDVSEFRLDNGMLFLVVERHTTPQIACRLAIRAGSALQHNPPSP